MAPRGRLACVLWMAAAGWVAAAAGAREPGLSVAVSLTKDPMGDLTLAVWQHNLASKLDADALARAAKELGARSLVLRVKWLDGLVLHDTKTTKFRTRRDFAAELAARSQPVADAYRKLVGAPIADATPATLARFNALSVAGLLREIRALAEEHQPGCTIILCGVARRMAAGGPFAQQVAPLPATLAGEPAATCSDPARFRVILARRAGGHVVHVIDRTAGAARFAPAAVALTLSAPRLGNPTRIALPKGAPAVSRAGDTIAVTLRPDPVASVVLR